MIVADASVVLKWVLPAEPGTEAALALRSRHMSGVDRIAAPVLLYHEVANVLALTPRLTEAEALEACESLKLSGLAVYAPGVRQMQRAVELARQARLSAYDAAYVALAETLGCDLVTADVRLARKLEGVDLNCTVRTL